MKRESVRNVFLATDWLIFGVCIALGVLIMLIDGKLVVLGACVAAFAPFFRHGYRIEGHPGVFRLEEVIVPRSCQDALLSFLKGESDTLDASPSAAGGALVRVFRKPDGTLLAQFFDYAQHLQGTEYPFLPVTQSQVEAVKKLHILQ